MMKLLMSWNIKDGLENAYFEFVVKEFAPGIMKMGLQPTEAWYTIYGRGPQILTAGVTENLDTMLAILESPEWQELREKLLTYVEDFDYKIVPATGRFQL